MRLNKFYTFRAKKGESEPKIARNETVSQPNNNAWLSYVDLRFWKQSQTQPNKPTEGAREKEKKRKQHKMCEFYCIENTIRIVTNIMFAGVYKLGQ